MQPQKQPRLVFHARCLNVHIHVVQPRRAQAVTYVVVPVERVCACAPALHLSFFWAGNS